MHTNRMLTLVVALLFAGVGLGLWSYSTPAAAAESEPSDTATVEDADSEAPSGTPSSEVFIPTEEISEGFAVSFPVDI